jgi:hypothetical protein
MTRDRLLDAVWFVLVAGLSSAWAVSAGQRLGATFDEPAHLDAGLKCWRSGSYKPLMRWGAMPLPIDVQTLPVYLWERHRGEPFEPYLQLPELLPVARAATLPFWWVLLFYGMAWGRSLGGPWAGRLACGLIAADPNLLGHAALATTDICLTACVLAAAYHFHVGRDAGWAVRVAVPGVLYGVALSAKASALPYVPLLYVVLGMHHLYRTGQLTGWAATRRLRCDLVAIGVIGFVYLFAYCGCDWEPEPSFVAWSHSLPDGRLRDVMVPVSEHLPVFTNAGEGLVQQVKHNMRGHGGAFVAGEYHHRAVWYYYPVALSAKLADPTLLLLAGVLLLRPRAVFSPAGWVVLALLLFSLNTRVQIGVRLAFPLVAFLLVTLAVAAASGTGRGTGAGSGRQTALAVLAGLCLVWTAAVSGTVWPDGLRHANSLWGGPDRCWEHLADSNADWGQGLPELADWHRANGEPKLSVWYYGGDPAVLTPPFRHLPVHLRPAPTPAAVAAEADGLLAVSVTLLTACPDRRPEVLAVVDWLKAQTPVARTGTFLIYDVRPAPVR